MSAVEIAARWNACADIGTPLSPEEASIASGQVLPFTVSIKHEGKRDFINVIATDSVSALIRVLEMFWPGVPAEKRPANLQITVQPQLRRVS